MNRIRIFLSSSWRAIWKVLIARWPEKIARPIVRILFLLYGVITILWIFALSNPQTLQPHMESGTVGLAVATTSDGISNTLATDYKLSKNYIAYLFQITKKHSNAYHLDPLLVMSIMAAESGFQVGATSNKGCVGLMQINWSMWDKELKRKGIVKSDINIYDPNINIEAGCFIYSSILNKNMGSNDRALNEYLGANGVLYRQNVYATYGRLKLIASNWSG
jgi:soluble lytic murein transglycosylase-like protein